MKAIILSSRVSTEEQKEAGNSLPAQIERMKQYCERKKFNIVKNFSFDESAYKTKRAERSRKLAPCENRTHEPKANVYNTKTVQDGA